MVCRHLLFTFTCEQYPYPEPRGSCVIWFGHKASIHWLSSVQLFLILCFQKIIFYSPDTPPQSCTQSTASLGPVCQGRGTCRARVAFLGGHYSASLRIKYPGIGWPLGGPGWADCFGLRTFFEICTFLIIKTWDAVAVALAAFCVLRVWQNGRISFPHN